MELLEKLIFDSGDVERSIELRVGDLTAIPPDSAGDLLIVSAFSDDYTPTPRSLIGALHRSGVSVADLAAQKEVDLRATCSCWMSRPISAGRGFKRILCFEPHSRGAPSEVVGDVFRSLIPFTEGPEAIKSAAMPLVSTGDMRVPAPVMLEALLREAVSWMNLGLSLERLVIVLRREAHRDEAREAFARLRAELDTDPPPVDDVFAHDVFLSYAHADEAHAEAVEESLLRHRPTLRIFRDRGHLEPGMLWQQELLAAIDDCHRIVCLLTPAYLKSRFCMKEFNLAYFRSDKYEFNYLVPLYLRSVALGMPSYVEATQFRDCREWSSDKLDLACRELVDDLNANPSPRF